MSLMCPWVPWYSNVVSPNIHKQILLCLLVFCTALNSLFNVVVGKFGCTTSNADLCCYALPSACFLRITWKQGKPCDSLPSPSVLKVEGHLSVGSSRIPKSSSGELWRTPELRQSALQSCDNRVPGLPECETEPSGKVFRDVATLHTV